MTTKAPAVLKINDWKNFTAKKEIIVRLLQFRISESEWFIVLLRSKTSNYSCICIYIINAECAISKFWSLEIWERKKNLSSAFENNLPALLQCETASGRSEPSTAQSTRSLPPSRFVKAQSQKTCQALNSRFVITKCPKPISRYSTNCFFCCCWWC